MANVYLHYAVDLWVPSYDGPAGGLALRSFAGTFTAANFGRPAVALPRAGGGRPTPSPLPARRTTGGAIDTSDPCPVAPQQPTSPYDSAAAEVD
jgi:hypothetical protein